VVFVDIAAPITNVWETLSDLKGHERWMGDVESIAFAGGVTSGPGTVMLVETKVGPLRLTDQMAVTLWEPPRRIVVEHQGLVTGTGEFVLDPIAGATRFTWTEQLRFPIHLGGRLTSMLSRPVLIWLWGRNLQRLKSLIEG
jgi:carbon monoxide dehydrogenase subunit G